MERVYNEAHKTKAFSKSMRFWKRFFIVVGNFVPYTIKSTP